jgi:hypothetical protein
MGILKSVGSVLSKAADFVFGTSSGSKLGQVVAGSGLKNLKEGTKSALVAVPITKAAELPGVAAKAITAGKGVLTSVATSLKTTIKANPLKSSIIGTLGVAYIAKDPIQGTKDITQGVGNFYSGIYNVGGNLQEFRADPSIENLTKIFEENPLISTAAAVTTLGGVGLAASRIAGGLQSGIGEGYIDTSTQFDGAAPEKNIPPTDKLLKETPMQTTQTGTSAVPITPETQVIGKAASSITKKRISRSMKKKTISINNRISILNQPHFTRSTRFIY